MAAQKDLVHIQANEELVMRIKILTAKRGAKMYEIVNGALIEWLKAPKQSREMEQIANLVDKPKEQKK